MKQLSIYTAADMRHSLALGKVRSYDIELWSGRLQLITQVMDCYCLVACNELVLKICSLQQDLMSAFSSGICTSDCA